MRYRERLADAGIERRLAPEVTRYQRNLATRPGAFEAFSVAKRDGAGSCQIPKPVRCRCATPLPRQS